MSDVSDLQHQILRAVDKYNEIENTLDPRTLQTPMWAKIKPMIVVTLLVYKNIILGKHHMK